VSVTHETKKDVNGYRKLSWDIAVKIAESARYTNYVTRITSRALRSVNALNASHFYIRCRRRSRNRRDGSISETSDSNSFRHSLHNLISANNTQLVVGKQTSRGPLSQPQLAELNPALIERISVAPSPKNIIRLKGMVAMAQAYIRRSHHYHFFSCSPRHIFVALLTPAAFYATRRQSLRWTRRD
jgi:hypothetical protein